MLRWGCGRFAIRPCRLLVGKQSLSMMGIIRVPLPNVWRQEFSSSGPLERPICRTLHSSIRVFSLYRIASDGTGDYLVAGTRIAKGTTILSEQGQVAAEPSMHSVQLSEKEHLEMPGDIRLTNHKCGRGANCSLQLRDTPTKHGSLVAGRDIEEGEPLTFDYATTEWEMESPFDCACGSPTCRGRVTGFKDLTSAQRESLPQDAISEYIRSRWHV